MSFNGSGTFVINTAGQPVVSGTVISSTAFNALTADLATGLSTCLTKDGQTTPTANIPMGSNKITGLALGTDATDAPTLSQVQSTVTKLIGSVSGTDTITGSLTPSLAAYAAGQMFYFVAAGDNTGAVTLNINSLGAKNITKNGTTALSAGDIKSGQTVAVIYDGTRFQVVGGAGLAGVTDSAKTTLGVNAGDSVTSGVYNVAIGYDAGTALTTGGVNTAVGAFSVNSATANNYITGVGYNAVKFPTGASNTALGAYAMQGAAGASCTENVAVGAYALEVVTSGSLNTAIGTNAGDSVTTGTQNTFLGYYAGSAITTANFNTHLGYNAGTNGGNVSSNTFVGYVGGYNIGGSGNTAVGHASMQGGGPGNTAASNTAIGFQSLFIILSGANNSGLGYRAGYSSISTYSNSTCVGSLSEVTGSNQVQLGDSSTTTYAYGAVQNRSDARDKADIKDSQLGLNFIMALRPRDFKWDMREDYKSAPPVQPALPDYNSEAEYDAAMATWSVAHAAWDEANKIGNLTHDGTHKRSRFHHGLVAQEVKAAMDSMGVDFGGYQDHSIKGGDAVLSIGYEEMIAPLIKAIQELKAEFDAYKATHP